ncbi:MAG: ATP-binding protein [Planctomycetota bacterium]|jgi:CheY-like chemotaxis protein/anti-sigma regulatory factor (Ser/Thr protein kinase)
MAQILVVDDSKVDRLLVEELLSECDGFRVEGAGDGEAALQAMEKTRPDLVVTDLVMPGMDGLELVAAVRKRDANIPVILMTSKGSEEIAVRALRVGAASYVPKSSLATDLVEMIHHVMSLSRKERQERRVLDAIRRTEVEFQIDNEDSLLRPLVIHLQSTAAQMGLCDDTECTQIGIALYEALTNAVEHGNLETPSGLRQRDFGSYFEMLRERRCREPYCDRRVYIEAHFDRREARFLVRDEGPGFDPDQLPDPRDPANLEKASGRGVLLMKTFMDEVIYDDRGNQVVMVKRRRE